MMSAKNHAFLFSELVKRDFKKKYKRTYLGMLWSLASPLLTLLVMTLVFTRFFGSSTPHYTIYLFCGNIVFSYFTDATGSSMGALLSNADILTKINVPKLLFVLSRSVTSTINFGMTFIAFLLFCVIDGIAPSFVHLALIWPIFWLFVFSLGVGLILSSLFVIFRDVQYLWSIFTMLLMYMSAIFYTVDVFPPEVQNLFYLNPLYVYITYFREVVIDGIIPTGGMHLLCVAYAVLFFALGMWSHSRLDKKFVYYV